MRETKMEILKFEGSSRAPLKQRKGFRVILGITVMGVFAALGSTLAANITINSSQAVEFGQGLSAAAACDSTITVKPRASFTNGTDTAGTFTLASLEFGGLDYASCNNKELVISTYDSGVATANYFGGTTNDSYTAVTVLIKSDSAVVASPASGEKPTIVSSVGSGSSETFTVTFGNPLTPAGKVYKVTVESRDPSN
jgi:hypothetical protein